MDYYKFQDQCTSLLTRNVRKNGLRRYVLMKIGGGNVNKCAAMGNYARLRIKINKIEKKAAKYLYSHGSPIRGRRTVL